MGASSLWGMVAERYEQPVELRAGELGSRFTAAFIGAALVITKSTGVQRIVDFDEFRAAWRILATDGSDDALRRVTGNGPYLRAVRADLILAGVQSDADIAGDGVDDMSSGEARLLAEAAEAELAASDPRAEVPLLAPGDDLASELARARESLAEAVAAFDLERAAKEEALREKIRLEAALDVLDERLRDETERADRLETALQKATSARPAATGTTGSRADIPSTLLSAALAILSSSQVPGDLRKPVEFAIDIARRDPAAAAGKARVVTEILVRREWSSVFGADASSTRKSFNDYARELDGHRSVDGTVLAVKRTLHRVANKGAHELDMSARRAALVVLVLAAVLDSEAS